MKKFLWATAMLALAWAVPGDASIPVHTTPNAPGTAPGCTQGTLDFSGNCTSIYILGIG